jgi:hypothetical protein
MAMKSTVSIILTLTLLLTVTNGLAEPPLTIKGFTLKGAHHYLNGAADGFQIMNAQLSRRGQTPLYCIPGKVVLYGRDLFELTSKDLAGPQNETDVVISALFGLMNKYPCKT